MCLYFVCCVFVLCVGTTLPLLLCDYILLRTHSLTLFLCVFLDDFLVYIYCDYYYSFFTIRFYYVLVFCFFKSVGRVHRKFCHVRLVLREVDFPLKIYMASTKNQKQKWMHHQARAEREWNHAHAKRMELQRLEQEQASRRQKSTTTKEEEEK